MPDNDSFVPVPTLAEEEQTPVTPPLTVGERARDIVDSVNSGIGNAVHEGAKAAASVASIPIRAGEFVTNTLMGTEHHLSLEALDATHRYIEDQKKPSGAAYQSKTVAGGLTQGVTQFITGFIVAGKTLKAVKGFSELGKVGQAVVTGAVADAAAFDPHQDRLSNLFNELTTNHQELRNPLTDFLAAKDTDTEAEGRLKNAIEGMAGGVVVEKLFQAMRALKGVWKAKDTQGAKAAEEALMKAAADLEATNPGQSRVGFSEGEISGGTRGMGQEEIVDSGSTPPRAEPPSQTQVTDELTPVEAAQREVAGMKPDDQSLKSAGVQGPDAPLVTPELAKTLTKALQDNPDWLAEGFVNTQKAGFNYSKMDSPDGAKLAMEEMAGLLKPTVKTFKELQADAKDLGVDVVDILASGKVGAKDITKTLLAGKALMQSTARQVADLARSVERNPGNRAELDKALQRLANVQTAVKNLQSEAARATAAGRIRTADSFSDAELKAIQAAGGDITALVKIVQEPPTWVKLFNAHNQYWINALLSGPRTHIRNVISNTLNTIALPVERMLGGLATNDAAAVKNGAGIALGLAHSIKDSFRLAVKASGLPDVAQGALKGDLLSNLKGTGYSILDPGNTKAAGGEVGRPLSTETFKGLQGTNAGTALDYFGEAVNIPSRFLTTEDEFFKQLNYRAQVYADALQEGQAKGLKGDDLAEYITDRIEKSMDESGAAQNAEALEYARTATFTDKPEPGSFLFKLENMAIQHPYIKLVLPFIRTPTNILKAAALRTPGLNLLSKKYREALKGDHGSLAKADAYGKMMTGGALWSMALTLAAEGAITGRGPADPRERQILLSTGWQPYSFKVNGSYVSFEGFDPMSMFFGLAGDYADAAAHMNEADRNTAIGSMLVAMANNVTSKTYLMGLSQVMEALTSPDKKMEQFIKNRAASYVPSGLKQSIGMIPALEDPYLRETRTVFDAMLNKLPGFSTTLPPKRNIFGEAVTARQAIGPDSISPFFYSQQKDDKAAAELARFSRVFSPPSPMIGNADLTQFKNAKGQDFYDRQQEQLQTLRVGRYTLKEALENLVTSQRYAKWRENEADAVELGAEPRTLKEVRAVIETYRKEAQRKTLAEFPEVQELVRAQKKVDVKASKGSAIPGQLQDLINQLNPNR